ncbi:sulfatase [Flammeovirga sp. MY04]|uniref:sulfatase n=1 Tax=Flammeovirga sp. MY04 TaxID=1191459 RepID=UPI00080630B2|nr:sulfatase [Flammeovirga sp. MY04]ANQ52379.1 sulfatase [Flammeovirga sp. MY04]
MKYKFILIPCLLFTIFSCNEKVASKKSNKLEKPNVIFISFDDLRPEMGTYGSKLAITPNIDRLASQGLQFNKAYCQQAICSPSRASLMTGARPETINVIENYTYFRDENPDILTLPEHFKNNGYETINCGKVYHGKYNDPGRSWSKEPDYASLPYEVKTLVEQYVDPDNKKIFAENKAKMLKKYKKQHGLGMGPAYECVDVEDNAYIDGVNTDMAIDIIKKHKDGDKPLFLGLGFVAAHLDFLAPKKYWDLYDEDKITLSNQHTGPLNGAPMGLHASFEMRVRSNIPKYGAFPDSLARTLKHGYLATASYIDAQVGKVLKALEEKDMLDNTIVMLWSDHGYHLGEMGIWAKATNYDISTRVPLVVWTPNQNDKSRGMKSDALVELVDMYPTLCDLAGLEKPSHLEGQSFAPLLENPAMEWKSAAFSLFPTPALREWAANPLSKGMRESYFGPLIEDVEERIINVMGDKWDREFFENYLMGYSMKTQRYNFVVWRDRRDKTSEPIFIELYDHEKDPKETVNIAEQNPELVAELMEQFNRGWEGNTAKIAL